MFRDRKGKPAEQERGHEEKDACHHRLLLGVRDRGNEKAGAQGRQEKRHGASKQHQSAATERNAEDQQRGRRHERHLEKSNHGKGKDLAQHQLDRNDPDRGKGLHAGVDEVIITAGDRQCRGFVRFLRGTDRVQWKYRAPLLLPPYVLSAPRVSRGLVPCASALSGA